MQKTIRDGDRQDCLVSIGRCRSQERQIAVQNSMVLICRADDVADDCPEHGEREFLVPGTG